MLGIHLKVSFKRVADELDIPCASACQLRTHASAGTHALYAVVPTERLMSAEGTINELHIPSASPSRKGSLTLLPPMRLRVSLNSTHEAAGRTLSPSWCESTQDRPLNVHFRMGWRLE